MTITRRIVLLSSLTPLGLAGCTQPVARSTAPPTRKPAASSPVPDATPPRVDGPLRATELVSGITTLSGLAGLPDDRVLVAERETGAIKMVAQGTMTTLTTLPDIDAGPASGLLGLAVDIASVPQESSVFAYWVGANQSQVSRLPFDGERLGAPQEILGRVPRGDRHNGGALTLATDGHLYVGLGDAGMPDRAQNEVAMVGKVLRLNRDGSVPDTNGSDLPIYTSGHRNVTGLALVPTLGMWCCEPGETADELNHLRPGNDYGWPGATPATTGTGELDPNGTKGAPVVTWRPDDAGPAGLAYWRGSLFLTARRGERLWQIPVSQAGIGTPVDHFAGEHGPLGPITVTADGSALLVGTGNGGGATDRVFRVEPA